jgi:hypothetical protein
MYLGDAPVFNRESLDSAVGNIIGNLRRHSDTLRDVKVGMDANGIEHTPEQVVKHQADSKEMSAVADWAEKEHAAGNFKVGDGLTRNFVVFNPKDIEIRTWDGRLLEQVDHNPFDVTRP